MDQYKTLQYLDTVMRNLRRKGSTTAIINLINAIPSAILCTGTRAQFQQIIKDHGVDTDRNRIKNITCTSNPPDFSDIDAPVIVDTSFIRAILETGAYDNRQLELQINNLKAQSIDFQKQKQSLRNTLNKYNRYFPAIQNWSKDTIGKLEEEDPIKQTIRFIEKYYFDFLFEKSKRSTLRIQALKYKRILPKH